ncbi:MAG: hypothetical protein QGH66_09580 [Dehalococcoidia bacterium]|jgi:hypothetical protein|nr:hypothetical protein [Dehalococcoidia bacterium]MDP7239926.1 hypothetical protein [Dehalococcoidia bacterium]MDP7470369.1 hypothetical protein [Dehalococcoidia bacterium]
MKKRGSTRRLDRSRGRQVEQQQGAEPQAVAPPRASTKSMVTVQPVGSVSHSKVLSDICNIGIIGAAALIVLLVLFVVWR